MFRAKKCALLALAFVLAPFLSGQDSLRILDPQSLSAAGSGWSVATNTGQLGMVFPFATVPGEIPIAVPFQLLGSHVVETRWIPDPDWDPNDTPRPILIQRIQDRPVHGRMHFGFIRPAGEYDGVLDTTLYVLEDGAQFRDRDTTTTWNPSAAPLEAPEKFGLAQRGWPNVKTHVNTRLITYDATLANLGSWSDEVTLLAPQGFTASSGYKVIMDKDLARIFTFLPELGVWAPILWVDRFNHWVGFQWKQGTASGVTVTSVKALNHRGLGVQMQWAAGVTDPETEEVLLRADFIGFQAPSIQVKGYSGTSMNRPSVLGGNSIRIDPFRAGPMLRPTQIQTDAPNSLPVPPWLLAGFPVPPAAGNDPWGSGLQWTFSYDAAHAELTSFTDSLGVTTDFVNTSHTLYEGLGRRNHNLVRGVRTATSVDLTAPSTINGTTFTRTWTRITPVYSDSTGWSQSEWKTTLEQGFNSSDATEIPTQEWVFAGPSQATHYANGALFSSRYFTAAKTWVENIPALFAWGIDGSLSGDGGNSMIMDGQPQREITSTPDSITGLKTTESLAVGGETWQTVTTTLEARPGLLDPGRPTVIATKRNVNGALVAAPTQKMAYDPTTGLVNRSWTEAGTLKQGQEFTYDPVDGRLLTVSSYPTGTPSRSTTYTPGTNGLPQSATTTFSTPNDGVNTFSESWTYDAAGRVLTATDGRGVTTTVGYDARGRVLSQSANGAAPVIITYSGERGTSWISAGLTVWETRDGFGRLFERTRANGSVEKPTYDRLGRTVAFRETPAGAPMGGERTATFEYDPLSRTVGTVSPASPQTTSLTFTADGTSAKVTSLLTNGTANGVASTVWKDPLGQTIKTSDPWSTVTSTYNALGQPKTIVQTADGLSQTRDFNYDALGRLTSRTEPETGLTTFSVFDAFGNPTSIQDSTRTRTLAFDGLGRLRTLTNSTDASSSSTVFDGLTLKESTTVSNGQTVTQDYLFNNPGGRLSSEGISGTTNRIRYAYNTQFQLETLTYPSGREVGYHYDTRGRVDAITQNGLPLATVGYDDAKFGGRNRLTFASGAKSEWTSTANGTHLDSWTVTPNGGTPELNGFTRDGNGNLSKASGWDPLKHDDAGRLTEATGFGLSEAMAHDGFGNNISSVPNPNSPAPPSNLNHFTFTAMPDNKVPTQTTSPTVASTGWAYRTNGEALSFGKGVGAAAPTVGLTWDGLGRMATATSEGTTWTNTYAPSGMRTQLIDSTTSANNRRYDYTTGGLLLSEYAPGRGGHNSEHSVRVYHSPISPGTLSRNLGAFQAGDVVNVSLWFKAPTGVSASVALTDGKPYTSDDNKTFKAAPGNGAWQQLTFNWTLTKVATLWLHLTADRATATSVQYDGVQVTSIGRSTVMTENFESGLNIGTDPSSLTTWYSCGQLNELVSSGTLPDTWKRDVIYLGGEAIAEIDADGVHELHNDHLGSPRVITSRATGAVEGRQVFGPYGEIIPTVTSGYQPLSGYTGHVQQDPSGLIYMRGRFYTPAWHRFINSDQGVDPMSWNQMAYVGGSPMQATDPSGMVEAAFNQGGKCYLAVWEAGGSIDRYKGEGWNIYEIPCGGSNPGANSSGNSDKISGGGGDQPPPEKDRDCIEMYGDAASGFGDQLTGGFLNTFGFWEALTGAPAISATEGVRMLMDSNQFVDQGSWSYAGGELAGSLIQGYGTGSFARSGGTVFGYGTKGVRLHDAHHAFNGVRMSHLQVNTWQVGVKGSKKVFRLPLSDKAAKIIGKTKCIKK